MKQEQDCICEQTESYRMISEINWRESTHAKEKTTMQQ